MVFATFKDAVNGLLSSGAFYIALGFVVLIIVAIVLLLVLNRKKKK